MTLLHRWLLTRRSRGTRIGSAGSFVMQLCSEPRPTFGNLSHIALVARSSRASLRQVPAALQVDAAKAVAWRQVGVASEQTQTRGLHAVAPALQGLR